MLFFLKNMKIFFVLVAIFLITLNCKTVNDVIWDGSCTTTSISGLSQQLSEMLVKQFPDLISNIHESNRIQLSSAARVVPILQKTAYLNLNSALIKYPSLNLEINSAFRLCTQQTLLYKWYQNKLCGISLAASPGRSAHESGLAVDLSNYDQWISKLTYFGFQWQGSDDPVHFTYVGSGAQSLSYYNVLAFQKLWNCNNPNDRISEDGAFGPSTEEKILASPANGFPQTC